MSFLHTMRLRLAILAERLQGLDFTRANQQPTELGLDEREVFIPSPSGGRHLRRLLDDLVIHPGEAALDIGCAKGSAMRDLLRHPFASVDGLELSPELATIARRNFARLQERRVQIHCMDARQFRRYGNYAVFYLYNPFPPPILEQVLDVLLAQTPAGAERVVIYNNPTGHAEMLRAGFHLLKRYPDFWGHGIQVYSNRPGSKRLRS